MRFPVPLRGRAGGGAVPAPGAVTGAPAWARNGRCPRAAFERDAERVGRAGTASHVLNRCGSFVDTASDVVRGQSPEPAACHGQGCPRRSERRDAGRPRVLRQSSVQVGMRCGNKRSPHGRTPQTRSAALALFPRSQDAPLLPGAAGSLCPARCLVARPRLPPPVRGPTARHRLSCRLPCCGL